MSANGAVDPVATTELIGRACAGDKLLDVLDATILVVGATVIVESGDRKEEGVIVNVEPVELDVSLANTYPVGSNVTVKFTRAVPEGVVENAALDEEREVEVIPDTDSEW
eukprot:5743802-Pyramimonas_sp.AAC.1